MLHKSGVYPLFAALLGTSQVSFLPHPTQTEDQILTVLTSNPRLHKPGVVGSSPTAAICHTEASFYHSWPEISCSMLKKLRDSPLAFYWHFIAREAPPYQSDSLTYGSLLHTWAEIGEEEFWPRVDVAPDSLCTATGSLSKKADTWLADLGPDRIPVSPADRKKLRDQTNVLLANAEVQALIRDRVDAEFNIRWSWAGHDCRCRVDGATSDCFFDWKTTRDSHPLKTWWRSVLDFGYHLQSAMYQAAGVAAGWPEERMRFVVTSTVWPHECAVVVLPHALVSRGRDECLRLLDELESRKEWDFWDRYESQGTTELFVPAFALKGV